MNGMYHTGVTTQPVNPMYVTQYDTKTNSPIRSGYIEDLHGKPAKACTLAYIQCRFQLTHH